MSYGEESRQNQSEFSLDLVSGKMSFHFRYASSNASTFQSTAHHILDNTRFLKSIKTIELLNLVHDEYRDLKST